MGDKWKNPPVFYTVAQLRFNPVLNMEKYLPEIQDGMRLRGFTDFRHENEAHFEIDMGSQQLAAREVTRWSFSDKKRTQAYILTTSALAFHTTSYETFAKFSDQVVLGLEDVHKAARLDSLDRVGLRYLDAVTTTNTLSIEEALDPKLFGAFTSLDGKLEHSYLETVQQVANRRLTSKVFIVGQGLPVPPDLHPLPLNLPDRFIGLQHPTATLDNDCSSNEPIDLGSGQVQECIAKELRALKDPLKKAFKCATTDAARREWM